MYVPLAPCSQCHRHVRAQEPRCPFCGHGLTAARPSVPEARGRLTRAAAFAFGLSLSACSASVGPSGDASTDTADATPPRDNAPAADAPGDRSAPDDGGVAALYGDPPPRDAGPPDDNGGSAGEYGAPPPPRDAGVSDDGGVFAMYGLPAPTDAGPPDDGGANADYGAPPPRDAG